MAIELRYEGKTYSEISMLLSQKFKFDFKEGTVRKWFQRGGMLELMYLDYARKENDRRRQVIVEELKKVTQVIPEKYSDILNRQLTNLDDEGQLKANEVVRKTLKDLCDILGFKIQPDDNADRDPLDDYFSRAEEEHKKKNNAEGTSA